jgi:hypothetical protein
MAMRKMMGREGGATMEVEVFRALGFERPVLGVDECDG